MELVYFLPLEICFHIEDMKLKFEFHDRLIKAREHIGSKFIRFSYKLNQRMLSSSLTSPIFFPSLPLPFFFLSYNSDCYKTASGTRIAQVLIEGDYFLGIKKDVFTEVIIGDYFCETYDRKPRIIDHYIEKIITWIIDFSLFYSVFLICTFVFKNKLDNNFI